MLPCISTAMTYSYYFVLTFPHLHMTPDYEGEICWFSDGKPFFFTIRNPSHFSEHDTFVIVIQLFFVVMYLFSERPLAHTHYNGRAPTMVLTRARYKLRFARISDHFFIRLLFSTKTKKSINLINYGLKY